MLSFLTQITQLIKPSLLEELKDSGSNAPRQIIDYVASVVAASSSGDDVESFLKELCSQEVAGCLKDEGYSAACKAQGNAAFALGKYNDAIRHYQQALRFLDETQEGVSASRLYNNRALCFDKMKYYQQAIEDSTCAIRCDPTFTKAYWRRAMAHKALKQYASALEDAEKTLQLQEAQNEHTADTAAMIAYLQQHVNTQGGVAGEPQWTTHTVPLEVHQDGEGPAVPAEGQVAKECSIDTAAAIASSMSAMLTVQANEVYGRQLMTNATIPPGTDVYTEMPFAHVNAKRTRLKTCSHCSKTLPDACYFCARCPMVAYCSPTCREFDVFHRPGGPECGLPWAALLPPEVVLALRLARRINSTDTDLSSLVSSLETGLEAMLEEDIAHHAALAHIANRVWHRAVQEGSLATPSERELTAAQVFKALCQIRVNGVALVPPRQTGEGDRLGLAVYGITSMMNHACQPNVALRFEGNAVVVRAVENLPKGGPLWHCYGPQVGEMTNMQRNLLLSRQYGFVCRCPACTSPPASDTQLVGLKCSNPNCSGAVSAPQELAEDLVSRYPYQIEDGIKAGSCSVCHTTIPAPEWEAVLKDLEAGKQLCTEGHAAITKNDSQAALKALLRCSQLRERLHNFNQIRGATEDALAMAYHVAGKPVQAAVHLRRSLAIAEHHYPADSTNVAYQQMKLAMLLQEAAKQGKEGDNKVEAAVLLRGAMSVLERHFGSDAALQDYSWN